ncbi:protein serine/threonine phosphatase 2C [Ascodesmis nigricans]|uniref:Protein serine/threonine phosphatase 2C n=1 Tax=Ascodesmis nigricans TaxID=341454 RepID=A0A4S2N339_9PEZI|nr:protein serine/threonine phosphatase 2C [Ascodesmis nigricans]
MPLPHRTVALRLLLRNPVLLRPAALRTALAAVPRPVVLPRLPSSASIRTASSQSTPPQSSGSSMHFKRLALVASGVVLATAYLYRDSLAELSGISTPASAVTPASAATPSGKSVLVVDHGSLYTGTVPPSTPISKETDNDGRKVVEMLSPEEATRKLRRNEESYLVNRGRGVFRYDVVQIPSNDPIEDDHVEKIIEVPSNNTDDPTDWMFWGVFDGHSGWTTSAKLRQVLIGFVARELNATYKDALVTKSLPTPEKIDAAIKSGFLKLDHEIVHGSVEKVLKTSSKVVAAETLAPALSGSCALLAFYESRSQQLRVAVTGDSRAVLGRRNPTSGKWVATPLSVDQTGSSPSEEARLRAEHPNEQYVVHNGRVLGGLEPTRAFGDAWYKWTQEVQMKLKMDYFGRTPNPRLKTPPYVTAEPVVTTTKIEPENGDFVVMATDGLWEMLTNEEVVGLVGKWIEEQQKVGAPAAGSTGNHGGKWFASWRGGNNAAEKNQLPVHAETEQAEKTGQKTPPIRVRQWGVKSEEERFVCEDKNAATHLVRNALGGKNSDMLCALLTLPSPYSRRYRDDLTVEVIFFGNTDNIGTVTVNEEATAQKQVNTTTTPEAPAAAAPALEAKPKL